MKRTICILALLVLLPAAAGAERYPYPFYPLPEQSAAAPFGTMSLFYNPAALAQSQELEVAYMHSFDSDRFAGDNTFAMTRAGLGLGYQSYRLSGSPAISAYTLGFSSHLSRGLFLGSSYAFMKTDRAGYNNDHFWNLGILARPSRGGSLAFVVNNLKRMEFAGVRTEIEYKLSLGVRPLGEKVTLSADWGWAESEAFGDGQLKGYASARVMDGLALYGALDDDGNFGLGLTLSFGPAFLGSYHSYSDQGKYRAGVLYSGYTYRPGGWLLPAPRRFLKVDLKGSYPETGKRAFFWQRPPHTFLELTRSLNRALDDRGIGGLYLNLEGISLGWSQLREVRELVKQFRRSGKPVYAYLGMLPNNRQYYLASAADGIAMRRYDELLLIGLLAEVTFYKGTLDKLGIVADLEHAGKYKAASELLTRDSISEYHRESLNQLLDDTYAAFLEEIADGRRLSGDSLQRLIDGAPMVSRDAIAAGLVDEVLYPDQVKEWQKRVFGGQRGVALAEYDRRQPYSERWGQLPQIAVIPVEGMLVSGSSGDIPLFGQTVGSDDLGAAIKAARECRNVKAVVLRINSPGGDALASDLLARELTLLREKKPLVVSMSNIAASAGYHLASGGDYVLAEPATVTGSIGVISGKMDFSGFYDKLGFNTYFSKRGANADYFSWAVGYTPAQREKVREDLRLSYDDFLETVAEGRKLSKAYVDSIGQGHVWSGRRALQLRLVDTIGGLWDAVERARALAGLSGSEVEIVSYPLRKATLLEADYGLALARELGQLLGLTSARGINTDSFTPPSSFYLLPYHLEIR